LDILGHWIAFEPSPPNLAVTSSFPVMLSQLCHTSQCTSLLPSFVRVMNVTLQSTMVVLLPGSAKHPKSRSIVYVQDIHPQVELVLDLGDDIQGTAPRVNSINASFKAVTVCPLLSHGHITGSFLYWALLQ
jgi:hypothetical protein